MLLYISHSLFELLPMMSDLFIFHFNVING